MQSPMYRPQMLHRLLRNLLLPPRPERFALLPIARRIARERGIDLALVAGTGPGGRIVEQDVLDYRGAASPPQPEAVPSTPGRVERASPIARRLAREQGIDLALVTGTGPGGRIVEQDILEYQPPVSPETAPEPEQVASEGDRADLSRMRQVIARVTSRQQAGRASLLSDRHGGYDEGDGPPPRHQRRRPRGNQSQRQRPDCEGRCHRPATLPQIQRLLPETTTSR